MAYDVKQAYGTEGVGYTAPVNGDKQSGAVVQAALQNLEELLASLLASTETSAKRTVSSLLGDVLSGLTAQLKVVLNGDPAKGGELIANFVPFFNQLVESDPSAMTQIEEEFGKLFNDYAAENKDKPNNLYAVLQGMGKMLLVPTEVETADDEVPDTKEETSSAMSTVNFNSILAYDGKSFADIGASMAVAVQQQEVSQTELQSKVGTMIADQGDAQVKEAEKKQQELADAIEAMHRAERRARHSQASMFGISIAIAVLAVAVTAITFGAAAALVVMAVTAFMMSPAFSMAIGALSSEIQKGTNLSSHEADIFAKMTLLVGVVVASGGVAYAAAPEAGGAVAVEEGAVTAGNTAVQNAMAFAEMQFWTNLAAMNPMQDGIEQLRENGQISDEVAIGLEVTCVLVCMFMVMRPEACGLGASPMARMASSMGRNSPFALGSESFLARNYTVISNWSQRIQGTMELLMAGAHARMAKAYSEVADSQEKQAEVMAETQLVQTLLTINTSLQKSSQQTMQGSLKGLQEALQIITDEAGSAMGSAAYVIAHT